MSQASHFLQLKWSEIYIYLKEDFVLWNSCSYNSMSVETLKRGNPKKGQINLKFNDNKKTLKVINFKSVSEKKLFGQQLLRLSSLNI